MIGKKEILEMTPKELEDYLNSCVSNIKTVSSDASHIKGEMIEEAKKLFNSGIEVSIPYYTNREIAICIGQVHITFKVSAKATGKTTQVTRLRKKDIQCAGKFKFDDIRIRFYNPYFEPDDIKKFKIKVSPNYITGGGEISLKHRNCKINEMLTKEALKLELEAQDNDWKNVRESVILNAAQPMIKDAYFKSDFNEKKWNEILKKTEEVNLELINQEIEKMFTINYNNATY